MSAEPWIRGEVPLPASLEYTERDTPWRMAVVTAAPAKPPAAAVPVKAPLKISAKTWGTTLMFIMRITTVPSR